MKNETWKKRKTEGNQVWKLINEEKIRITTTTINTIIMIIN